MARKDTLAAGARSAKFAGGVGETDLFRNLSKEARTEEVIDTAVAPVAKKRFRPLGDVILVRRVEPETNKSGVIILEETAKKEVPAEGVVLEIGKNVTTIKRTETIAFGKYSGTEFKLNGETLLLMRIEDVLGVIENVKKRKSKWN